MRAKILSIPVQDQEKALQFYTTKLGFLKKEDTPVSNDSRWLTVVSKEEPVGVEILLEPAPNHFEPAKVFQKALFEAGIPWTQFDTESVQKDYERLVDLDVQFSVEPTEMGTVKFAVFNDTCGNNIQIVEMLQTNK
jgi:catechol 2,3-dioxygenase-like lactoylglutathione lyase family enzyme